ncbi:hypothetical protein [Ruegeria sp.]|uniref:hypothetical protein n=1 Tax=Ruegeria sp. TaxID=1879320 RepID=UPI003B0070AC
MMGAINGEASTHCSLILGHKQKKAQETALTFWKNWPGSKTAAQGASEQVRRNIPAPGPLRAPEITAARNRRNAQQVEFDIQ